MIHENAFENVAWKWRPFSPGEDKLKQHHECFTHIYHINTLQALTLNMLNYWKGYKRYIEILNHILDFGWPKLMKLSLSGKEYTLSVLHSQYHACWCYDDFGSQGISRHGIDLISMEYSVFSIRRVNLSGAELKYNALAPYITRSSATLILTMGNADFLMFIKNELKNKRPVGLSSFVNCPPVVASFLTQRQLSINAGWQHMGRVPHPNYVDPECYVATVCHHVRFMYWEHLGHFQRAISHLKWH